MHIPSGRENARWLCKRGRVSAGVAYRQNLFLAAQIHTCPAPRKFATFQVARDWMVMGRDD
jgi:hypothetical protein